VSLGATAPKLGAAMVTTMGTAVRGAVCGRLPHGYASLVNGRPAGIPFVQGKERLVEGKGGSLP
jgi:hypothetical protein